MIPLTDELADLVIKAVTCRLALAGMSEAEVGITLVDDETIAQLNSDYRGIAAKTDVLSFPVRGSDADCGGTTIG